MRNQAVSLTALVSAFVYGIVVSDYWGAVTVALMTFVYALAIARKEEVTGG